MPEEESMHPSGRTGRSGAALANAVLAVGLLGVVSLAVPGIAGGASSTLGTPHPATGSPVTLGMISDGGSGTVGTAPLVEQGARAAVAYQNEYGDGLEGHKIDLYI